MKCRLQLPAQRCHLCGSCGFCGNQLLQSQKGWSHCECSSSLSKRGRNDAKLSAKDFRCEYSNTCELHNKREVDGFSLLHQNKLGFCLVEDIFPCQETFPLTFFARLYCFGILILFSMCFNSETWSKSIHEQVGFQVKCWWKTSTASFTLSWVSQGSLHCEQMSDLTKGRGKGR